VDSAAATAAASLWVNQAAQQVENVSTRAAQQSAALWAGFTGWYAADRVAQQAAESAQVSAQAEQTVADLMAQYVAEMVAALRGTGTVQIPQVGTPEVRNGIDPVKVFSRPAKAYRIEYAQSKDPNTALQAAMDRVQGLIEANVMLAVRQAQDDAMQQLEVTHYRRVLHPELSRTGSCGLCIAASLKVYTVSDLMPLHNNCKCLTMPIIGGLDPAEQINEADRQAAYAASPSGKSALSNVRFQVNEHGELGPVLTVKGDHFTGPNDLNQPAA
jgi:hypothetical protein